MTTHWLDNGPEGWMVPTVLDVSDEFCPPGGEERALLFSLRPSLPDRARQPAELGGRELRVVGTSTGTARCLACGTEGEMRALELEDGYGAAQCGCCGQYNWFRRSEEQKDNG